MAPKRKQGNRKKTKTSNRNWKKKTSKSERKLSGGNSNTNTNNECISRRHLRNTGKCTDENCLKWIKQHKSELNISVRKTYKCQVEYHKKDTEVCKQKKRIKNLASELENELKQNTTYATQLEQVQQENAVALKQAKHFETELSKSNKSYKEAKDQTIKLCNDKHLLVAEIKKIATKHKLIEDELLKNTKKLKKNQDEKKYLLKMKDPVFGKRPQPLRNVGSTCFMNAILQTLAWTPMLGGELQKQLSDMHGIPSADTCFPDMTESTFHLICYTHNDNTAHSSSSVPREMLKSARNKNNIFEGCQQQDSFEMFNTIVNGLKEETISFYKEMIRNTKVQITDPDILRRYGAVRLFSGKFITVYKYSSCHHVESVFQRFTSITVPIIKGKTTEKFMDKDKGTRRRKLMEMNGSPTQFCEDCCSDPHCNRDRCGIQCTLSENKAGYSNDEMFYDTQDLLYSPTTQNVETQIYEGDFVDNITTIGCLEGVECSKDVHNPFDTIAGNVSLTTDIEKGLSQGLMKIETFPENIISCRKCAMPEKTGSSFKKTLILEPPHILVLHIDRFKKVYQKDTQSRLSYGLYGVVVHSGTMNSGHYEAYIKTSARSETLLYDDFFGKYFDSPENRKRDIECFLERQQIQSEMTGTDNVGSWFNVSDEYLHECSEHDAINNSDAYILMYERL